MAGSAVAKLCIIFMLQYEEYFGNLQYSKIPLSLSYKNLFCAKKKISFSVSAL